LQPTISNLKMSQATTIPSIYIPRVRNYHTVQSVGHALYYGGIGIIRRVDFVPIEDNDQYLSAFVHMEDLTNILLDQFEEEKGYKFFLGPDEYWILLKATTVIPETRLNLHQLAENQRLLEERQAESIDLLEEMHAEKHRYLKRRIEKQETTIERMKGDIERLQDTVYQLLARAFNRDTESEDISNYKNLLNNNDEDEDQDQDEDQDDEYADMPELISLSDEKQYYHYSDSDISQMAVYDYDADSN